MRIEFDPSKDKSNRQWHGMSLAVAESLDWDRMLVRRDARRDYGEVRQIGIAPIGSRLHVIVFTMRGETVRVISLRKANSREVAMYEKASQID